MAVNTSNDSLLHPDIPSVVDCYFTVPSSFIVTTFFITSILLLLPLCILIIYLGLQRWRQQRSTSAAAAVTSHSDSVTYHMVTMELVGVTGCTLCCCGIYGDANASIFLVGFALWSFTWYGESFFHILTCVEYYLAVIHPVTYLSLRGERGIRIRNVSIGCVWLLSFLATFQIVFADFPFFDFCILSVALIVISFCSLSVLLVLTRPGPGEQGGQRERVDQSKRRAFSTVVAILGTLTMRTFGNAVWCILYMIQSTGCGMIWFNLPSSLVLPLLFLHRAGTLSCCKKDTK